MGIVWSTVGAWKMMADCVNRKTYDLIILTTISLFFCQSSCFQVFTVHDYANGFSHIATVGYKKYRGTTTFWLIKYCLFHLEPFTTTRTRIKMTFHLSPNFNIYLWIADLNQIKINCKMCLLNVSFEWNHTLRKIQYVVMYCQLAFTFWQLIRLPMIAIKQPTDFSITHNSAYHTIDSSAII